MLRASFIVEIDVDWPGHPVCGYDVPIRAFTETGAIGKAITWVIDGEGARPDQIRGIRVTQMAQKVKQPDTSLRGRTRVKRRLG